MKHNFPLYLSTLLLSCTATPLQPLPPPTPQEQQAITLAQIDQQLSTICEKYTLNEKELHCTLPKEPFYIHCRWDEIKQTYCQESKLILNTIPDTKTINTPNLETCNTLNSEFNTYLRLVNKKNPR